MTQRPPPRVVALRGVIAATTALALALAATGAFAAASESRPLVHAPATRTTEYFDESGAMIATESTDYPAYCDQGSSTIRFGNVPSCEPRVERGVCRAEASGASTSNDRP